MRKVLISLGLGFLFVFGYHFAVIVYVFAFYRDRPEYAIRNVVNFAPLELPWSLYPLVFGHPPDRSRLTSWTLTFVDVLIYAAAAYLLLWAISKIFFSDRAVDQGPEPPPPPKFETPS